MRQTHEGCLWRLSLGTDVTPEGVAHQWKTAAVPSPGNHHHLREAQGQDQIGITHPAAQETGMDGTYRRITQNLARCRVCGLC